MCGPELDAEHARRWIRRRLRLAAIVTVTITVATAVVGVLGTRFATSRSSSAGNLRAAAGLGFMAATSCGFWLVRVGIAALVVRASDLRLCEINELRAIHHFGGYRTVLRFDADTVPCSVEHVGGLATGPALATRPAHWRVVVARGDRPRLANQPWGPSYGAMWNAWLDLPETPAVLPVRGPWTTGRWRARVR